MPSPKPLDAVLDEILRLMQGSEADRNRAIIRLHAQMGQQLLRRFQRHRIPEADAEELLYDVYQKLLGSRYRGEAPPEIFIRIVARSVMMSWFRKQRPDVVQGGDDDPDFLDRMIADAAAPRAILPAQPTEPWLRLCLQQALAEFERDHPARGEVARMIAEEWSAEEIGQYFGSKRGAARDRKHRTRDLIKEYIIRHCGDHP